MHHRVLLLTLIVMFGEIAVANAQPIRSATRGELLYSTYCLDCHTAEVYWRDKKLVTDRASLLAEVRRWQGFAGLEWSDDDIAEVARYLNAVHYHYAAPN